MIFANNRSCLNEEKETNPFEKLLFLFSQLFFLLIYDNLLIYLILCITNIIVIIKSNGLYYAKLYRLLLYPITFILLTSIPMLVNSPLNTEHSVQLIKIPFFNLFLSKSSMNTTLIFIFRAMTGSFIFLAFVIGTRIQEYIYILKKLRMPEILIELFILMYRFIHILIKISSDIYISQKGRNGYNNFFNSLRSLSLLISGVFIKSYFFADQSYHSIISRGYQGKFDILLEEYKFSIRNIFLLLLFNFTIILISQIKVDIIT